MAETFDEIDGEAWEPRAVRPIQTARDIAANIRPPKGRGEFTIPAQLALGQLLATIALVEAQEAANAIAAISAGVPTVTEPDETPSKVERTERYRKRRNRLKAIVREGLGL